jgi:uncharacterized protein
MTFSIYEMTIPQFRTELKALRHLLQKTRVWSDGKKIDVNVFLSMRLAPDMFPLSKQIQITCDGAKAFAGRLTTKAAPAFPDTETTFEQFVERINKTLAYLETIQPDDFKGWEAKTVEFPWNPGKYLRAPDYVIQHALPNFYFHLATTYAILRSNGVDLGKADYLGEQNWKSLSN